MPMVLFTVIVILATKLTTGENSYTTMLLMNVILFVLMLMLNLFGVLNIMLKENGFVNVDNTMLDILVKTTLVTEIVLMSNSDYHGTN